MPTLSNPGKVVTALFFSITAAFGAEDVALRSLVETEKNFAATSVERGIRESFLQFFADDSIIFAPEPKNGKRFYTDYEDKGRKLSWRPIFATVARSGELGVTTGPWELAKSKAEPAPIAFGDFLSIWRKQSDGSWKVIVDVGVDHERPGDLPAETKLQPPAELPANVDFDLARAALEKAEKRLAEAVKEGAGKGILTAASDDIRVLRQNSFPAVGRDAASAMLSSDNGKMTRENSGGGVSVACDLVYRYGSYSAERGNATERGYYLTIWRMENGDWKIIVDLQKKAADDQ